MASQQKPPPKNSSRWGFISQAVASVESRLDTILADDEVPSRKPTPQPGMIKENAPPVRSSTESTRATAPANDRLQERLARAMAKKTQPKPDSPIVSEPVSRASTPGIAVPSTNVESVETVTEPSFELNEESEATTTLQADDNVAHDVPVQPESEQLSAPEILMNDSKSQRPSKDSLRNSQDKPNTQPMGDEADEILLRAQLEHEDAKGKMQDEINGYIERIDSLNAKLQYLAKETAQSAKEVAVDVQSGSLERKLLEKDEKIALLMAEGQKLSMSEMKYLTTIKKLRAQATTSNKDQEALRQRIERAERSVATLGERAKKAEANAKIAEDKLQETFKQTRDLEAVTKERNALNETLTEMRTQIVKANTRAENAESKAQSEQLEAEKKKVVDLQDDLSSAKVERELAEEKLRQEIKDLKSSVEREKNQTRAMETEMLAEQAALEGKLEAFRVRAEEASSNDQGDAQAKLLRQVETLQSQYAAASQNWQGIEGTLLARITTLERERDELSTREADLRRKLRDATAKAKNNETEMEDCQLKCATLQETQSDLQAESQRLTKKTQQLEDEVARVQKEAEDQKVRMERDFARRLEEEKARWAASVQLSGISSPTASTRKNASQDSSYLMHPSYTDRPASRRSSALASPVIGGDAFSPSRHYSSSFFKNQHNGTIPETPSIVTSMDQDEYFAGTPGTPGSPDHTPSRRGVGDLISTSTVGAGPSVQLVERMSANVRRLESEKAASKDELVRLTTQRDESRQEVVRLMREVEQKRKIEKRLNDLEAEHAILNGRHQTTLELLGEKSEQVEELKADILDVKQMYRELADHMK